MSGIAAEASKGPSPQAAWDRLSQAERDAAYDNNAAMADSAAWVEARNRAAAAFRALHPDTLDLAYGSKPRQAIDLYPASQADAPCLVFIHGGYWQRNSREFFAHYAEGMLAAGWSVAMPSHTLAPDVHLAEIAGEIGMALDWLAADGSRHGVAGPIVLAGWSAGAHLTVLHLAHPAVSAGLAISGVYELAPIRDTYLNAALSLTDSEIATLSPLRLAVTPKPLAVAYGANELPALVHDSVALHARRAAAHAAGPLIAVEGANHFTVLDELRRPGGILVRAAKTLLAGSAR